MDEKISFELRLYLFQKNSNKANTSPVVRLPMRDFAGFSDCDSTTKKAMIDFSFHIAYGNMDEAFRAIKLIKKYDLNIVDMLKYCCGLNWSVEQIMECK